jgi:hypothetical protein
MTVFSPDTSGVKEYYGLAADVKPSSNVPVGSVFRAMDSGTSYLYDGSAWVESNRTVIQGDGDPLAEPWLVDTGQSVFAAAADAVGTDPFRWIAASAAAALTGVAAKASGGRVFGWHIANEHTTTAMYVHFGNSPSAAGSPLVTLKIPGGAVLDPPSMIVPVGGFTTGIWIWASANADGTGSPAAAPLVNAFIK